MKRVGGMAATKEFDKLSLSGYTRLAREKVAACSEPVHEPKEGSGSGASRWLHCQCERDSARATKCRATQHWQTLALRVLGLHAMSAATELNWCLWGRVLTAARRRLGLERTKKLITFCFNDRVSIKSDDGFQLLLSVIERDDVSDDGEEE